MVFNRAELEESCRRVREALYNHNVTLDEFAKTVEASRIAMSRLAALTAVMNKNRRESTTSPCGYSSLKEGGELRKCFALVKRLKRKGGAYGVAK